MILAALLAFAALGAGAEPAAEWLMRPAPEAAAKAGWRETRFSVDGRGRPWVLHDRRELICPVEGAQARLIAPADGLAHSGNASPLVGARGYLGVVPILEMVELGEDGRPKVPFKPLRRLPRRDCRVIGGAAGALFFVCRAEGAHELYRLARGKGRSFDLLLRVAEPVLAAAGDDKTAYAAVGAGVLRLDGEAKPLFRHPSGPVRDLAYDPAAGLFYAVEGEVGRWRPEGLEILFAARRPQVRALNGEVFVFSEEDWGIARLSGL